jgi:hypothetical protein
MKRWVGEQKRRDLTDRVLADRIAAFSGAGSLVSSNFFRKKFSRRVFRKVFGEVSEELSRSSRQVFRGDRFGMVFPQE